MLSFLVSGSTEWSVKVSGSREEVSRCIYHICGSPESRGGRRADRKGLRKDDEPNKCLGVFGLSPYTTERELEEHFSTFGRIEKCQVALDGHSGRSRGFAFIDFESSDDAKVARKEMDGKELNGKRIRIDFSDESALSTFTDFVRRRGGVRGRDDIMESESK